MASLSRDEVIGRLCETIGRIYNAAGDYSLAADCICDNPSDNPRATFCFEATWILDIIDESVNSPKIAQRRAESEGLSATR
jgi:hypothetical protein